MKNCEITWDLESLYSSTKLWDEDFAKLETLAENFADYKGRLAESPAVFKAAIEASDTFDRLSEKLYTYAHLRSDENTSIGVNRARVDRICAKLAELSALEAWFEPEVMAIPDDRMKELLESEELSFYRRSIEELLREKKHVLSECEERLLGQLSDVLGTSGELFSTLNDTDLRFGKVRGEDGKLKTLSHGSYRRFLESSDRTVRRNAFRKLYNTYEKFRNTFAVTLDATVKRHVTSARIRKFDSALQQALYPDNIPEAVYLNLISTVHNNLDGLFDYFKLRGEVLDLDKVDMYDLHCPLVTECKKEYDFAAASELVQSALAPLGEEYVKNLKRAWSERWIDVPERQGKRSGAYSSGCYDSFPYLLLNFQNTFDDVFTLAHELGHSMHSFYSRKYQEYHYADYEIFVAEVASTTNELLLSRHLLNNTDDHAFRAYLLGHLADEIRATIYRQTMFAEFELGIHRAVWDGEVLTADVLDENYFKLNAEYHCPFVETDPQIALEWARIPHFHYNFYVYKYATGMSAAIRLSERILSGDPAAVEAYLNFLKAGDSKDVLDIMRDAGVDLATPEPIDAALKFFKNTVTELRKELSFIG